MQYRMKIVKLQSDWLAQKQEQECWACKNQESAQMFTRPFTSQSMGSGDETTASAIKLVYSTGKGL